MSFTWMEEHCKYLSALKPFFTGLPSQYSSPKPALFMEFTRQQGGETSQPKGNQHWIFIGRTDVEAEAPILWPPDAKNWLIRKDPDVEKDWRQEEKGTTEAEMVGWHYWFNGHESEQALGVGQGRVVCCSSWGCKNLDTTQWLNLTEILGKNRVKKWTETCGIIKKDPTSISSDSQKERKKWSQKSIWRKKWLKILILINDT